MTHACCQGNRCMSTCQAARLAAERPLKVRDGLQNTPGVFRALDWGCPHKTEDSPSILLKECCKGMLHGMDGTVSQFSAAKIGDERSTRSLTLGVPWWTPPVAPLCPTGVLCGSTLHGRHGGGDVGGTRWEARACLRYCLRILDVAGASSGAASPGAGAVGRQPGRLGPAGRYPWRSRSVIVASISSREGT